MLAPMRCRLVVAALVALIVLAGCGSSTSGPQARPVTLMLDFTPNAVHAGIYAALAHGYDRQHGIALKVLPPPSPVDSIKLLEDGRVDFSLIDIHDLALARERGAQIEAIMAIVEQPLAAVIAQPQISSPRQLQGRTVGVPGDPSDYAVLDSVVAGAGGNPRRVHTIVIGSDAVGDLLAGRVAAATGFWNDEGVALGLRRARLSCLPCRRLRRPQISRACAVRATLDARAGSGPGARRGGLAHAWLRAHRRAA